ncbi:hypothetical protein DB31_2443 [Hyalangium minutum]|uniref:Uncharacterized protein n=1 Tax=Hyalangium minutum TaxID=394096 RepID=A0A085W8L7_9BACT|nr:hypothetical protein DB31_2443 [Hyalangium minutum]
MIDAARLPARQTCRIQRRFYNTVNAPAVPRLKVGERSPAFKGTPVPPPSVRLLLQRA